MTAMSKTILITGGSSGIGRATAVRLADAGHTVFAAARRVDRLAELARETSGTVIPVELDVCDPGSVRKAVETVAGVAPDGLDVLINNAGYALTGPAETLATDDVRAQFETNVIGLFDVTRAFLPQMRARRAGRIVNISSLLGRSPSREAGSTVAQSTLLRRCRTHCGWS
jgi:NADP-dependent 3-hydroxy acid dehydrogenase YdfG